MRIKVSVFHNACKSIVLSDAADAYAKALAQRGLGTWQADEIRRVALALVYSVIGLQHAGNARRIFKRYGRGMQP